jgi:membrane dipeptidase
MRPIFDAHLDLAGNALQWNRDLTRPLGDMNRAESHVADHPARGRATVSLPELRRSRVGVCLATVLVRAKPRAIPAAGASRRDLDFRTQTIASAVGRGQLAYYRLLEREGLIRILRTSRDLTRHWSEWSAAPETAPLGVIVAMEGADPIVDTEEAADWFEAGLRCVGLAHYGPGAYAVGTGATGPLTAAGRDLLRALESLGMIVDLTHCAEPGFFEVLDRFAGPVHASHNMCRALVPGDRQFSDEQIRHLIERDAVIGMAFDAWMLYPGWVTGQTTPEVVPIDRVADHVDHICQVAGNARHVGIGSDLDGGFGTEQCPSEFGSIFDLHRLEEILLGRGYRDEDLDAIFHGNWLRFFAESLPTPSGGEA